MASFLTSLWESIFTPGPTPTLLLATNATFGALQFLLLILLVTTHSIHFVALSILCGGLWYAINWFAAEVQAVKAKEEQEKQEGIDKDKEREKERRRRTSPDPGSDTETETDVRSTGAAAPAGGRLERRKLPPKPAYATTGTADAPSTASPQDSSASSAHLQPGASGKRLSDSGLLGDGSGYVSTDSEWEKVSEGEGEGKGKK
jgi:ER protein Pkr1